jgi:hypothetical protein
VMMSEARLQTTAWLCMATAWLLVPMLDTIPCFWCTNAEDRKTWRSGDPEAWLRL